MRANKPAIYGDSNCPLSIINHAKECGAKLLLSDNIKNHQPFKLNIQGKYQQKNAKTAIMALQTLKAQLTISGDDIKSALQEVKLSGRLEIISTNPAVILDVSHNEQAAQSLSQWLQDNPIKGKTIAVFAVLTDKKAAQWFDYFSEIIDVWCVSQVESARAMPVPDLITQLANTASLISSFISVETAMNKAQLMALPEDRIVVFGSFYTVSEALSAINKTKNNLDDC